MFTEKIEGESTENNPEQKDSPQILDVEGAAKSLGVTKADILQSIYQLEEREIGGVENPSEISDEDLAKKYDFGGELVAVMDGKVVGYLYFYYRKEQADLFETAVSSSSQKKHIGTYLMDELIETLRGVGVKKLNLTSTFEGVENPSMGFYQKYFNGREERGKSKLKFTQLGAYNKGFEVEI